MLTTPFEYLLVALAAVAAGLINALAGGGTLVTFPMLTFVGVPGVMASVTNTVALSPGYLGATFAQLKDLRGQERRVWLFAPISALGGVIGGILLLRTEEKLFSELIPYLILVAAVLLAIQDPIRAWVTRRAGSGSATRTENLAVIPVGLAAVYGGYFGAGLSVIVLAVLGLFIEESLTRLNGLKQAIAFCTNIAAAIFFLFSDKVVWPAALVMAVGALVGGVLGGKLAGRVKPATLRKVVVVIGVLVAIIYFVR